MLGSIKHDDLDGCSRRFQLQPELLPQRSEEGWRVRIRRRQVSSGRQRPALLRREGQDELPVAREARAIDNDTSGLADEDVGDLRHSVAVEANHPGTADSATSHEALGRRRSWRRLDLPFSRLFGERLTIARRWFE